MSEIMETQACITFLKGCGSSFRSKPDWRMYHVASTCLQPLLLDLQTRNLSLSQNEAAEFQSALKIYFYCIYCKENVVKPYDRLAQSKNIFRGLKLFYDFFIHISQFLYGSQCCYGNFICERVDCIKSQICLYAKSILQEYIAATGRNLPNSLQEMKDSFTYNNFCQICRDEDKPDTEFILLSDCRHIYCKKCFPVWMEACHSNGTDE